MDCWWKFVNHCFATLHLFLGEGEKGWVCGWETWLGRNANAMDGWKGDACIQIHISVVFPTGRMAWLVGGGENS